MLRTLGFGPDPPILEALVSSLTSSLPDTWAHGHRLKVPERALRNLEVTHFYTLAEHLWPFADFWRTYKSKPVICYLLEGSVSDSHTRQGFSKQCLQYREYLDA